MPGIELLLRIVLQSIPLDRINLVPECMTRLSGEPNYPKFTTVGTYQGGCRLFVTGHFVPGISSIKLFAYYRLLVCQMTI